MEVFKKVKRSGSHLTSVYWKDQILPIEYCLCHLKDLKQVKGGSEFSFSCCIFVAKDYKRVKLKFECSKGSIFCTLFSTVHEYYDLFKIQRVIVNIQTCLKRYCVQITPSEWTKIPLEDLFYEVLKYTGVAINDEVILRLYQLAVCWSLSNDKGTRKGCK